MVKKRNDTVLSVLQDIRGLLRKNCGSGTEKAIPTPKKTSYRFTDNGDNTVTDNLLGVAWVKDPSKVPGLEDTMDFAAAEKVCAGLRYSGKDGWRLPTVEELRSIVDYSHYNPAWDTNVFGGRYDDWYWTRTSCAWNKGDAWCVLSDCGGVSYGLKGSHGYVRPVRSSQ